MERKEREFFWQVTRGDQIHLVDAGASFGVVEDMFEVLSKMEERGFQIGDEGEETEE